jgi:hypothetical protein
MNRKWMNRLNAARGWLFGAALVVAAIVWMVKR